MESGYTVEPPVGGEGWAIQRVGPLVLGVWDVPLTEDRIHACRRLYRTARKEHGRLTVLAVFRTSPFSTETLAAQGARALSLSVLREFIGAFDAVVIVLDGRGFQGTFSRLAAAGFTQVVHRAVPITFPNSVDDGVIIARRAGAFRLVDEDTARAHLAELERRVQAHPVSRA